MKAIRTSGRGSTEREFEKLYLESYSLVYNFVRTRIGNDADTEDIVAEAFMNAARSFSSFDSRRAKFSTWVVAIARNCIVNHHRKARPTVAIEDVSEGAFAQPDESKTVDDRMLADLLLNCLDDDEREIVLLKFREGFRNVDIAEELNMSASTVSTKVARALAKMRDVLNSSKHDNS